MSTPTLSGRRYDARVARARVEATRPALHLDVRWLPWLLAGAFSLVYATIAVRRHELMYTSGYDLGIFEQAVRGYAEGTGPIVEIKGPGFNLLGDHFHPILMLLAPAYRLLPSPVTLLLAQSVLLALSVVPLTRWALRAVGERAAWIVGLGVGASWGIASAAAFDFHEIAFAVPLLAFSLAALGQGRLTAACAWAAPLVLVKEDLGITVAVIGALVAVRGARRLGLLTAVGGLTATALAVLVAIPAFNPSAEYAYWGKVDAATHDGSLGETVTSMLTADRGWTLLLLLAPTAFLALRSPLLLVAAPTMAWRFVSDNPAYHGTGYHYSAIVVPVLFAAFVEALTRRAAFRARAVRQALLVSIVVTATLLPSFPLATLLAAPDFERISAAASARDLLATIPDGATVMASNRLAPQLTSRTTVSLFGAITRPERCPDYIALDDRGIDRWLTDDFPSTRTAQTWLTDQARAHGYREVASDSWVTVLQRTGRPDPTYQQLVADGPPALLTADGGGGTEKAGDFVWSCS